MEHAERRHVGDIIKARERNIEIVGAAPTIIPSSAPWARASLPREVRLLAFFLHSIDGTK
jgi:hypothetical protein